MTCACSVSNSLGDYYEDGGKPFEPVKIDTEYVDVIS